MVATKKVVSKFTMWIEEDGNGKFTGHFLGGNSDEKVQLYESGSVKRIASRLSKVGMADMIKQFESITVTPVGVTFTADPVEHIPENVLTARKAQIEG